MTAGGGHVERPGIIAGFARRHATRTAERHAAFLLPHLRPGMRLLDVGCGPGTITVGLAAAVAPGEVLGLDLDAGAVARATALAAERGLANARFERGDARRLPFPDGAFDAAFAHTVLMHIPERLGVAREVHRVLRPGGVFALSERLDEGTVWAGGDPAALGRFRALHRAWCEHRGVDLALGGRLRAFLLGAGFARVEGSASFAAVYGTPEATREHAGMWIEGLTSSSLPAFAAAAGLATAAELEGLARAWAAWGEDPAAFHAQANGEALAWKDPGAPAP